MGIRVISPVPHASERVFFYARVKSMQRFAITVLLGVITIVMSEARLLFADDAIRIVTLGDSITKGIRTGVKAEETFAALLQESLRKKGVSAEVTNVGIGGERTDQALLRLDKVIALKPQIVTVMYGTNDSYIDPGKDRSRITVEEFRRNLKLIVKKLRDAGIVPVLMTEPRWGKSAQPNGSGEHPNLLLEKFMAACREEAQELKVPLVDNFQIWTAAEQDGTDIAEWTTDQCHPNPIGHRKLADAIRPVVEKSLKAPQNRQ
jgi:acyl-CoA thioesterase-1